MARLICVTSPVTMTRKSGTILLTEKNASRKALLPVVQTSEIFALRGAEPDGPLLSLLSQYAVPLHVFSEGKHVSSYLPATAILSGKTVLAQAQFLEDDVKRWKLAKEILRGGARIRTMAARILRPAEKDEWENRYLECLVEAYGDGLKGLDNTIKTFRKVDDQLLAREEWEEDSLAYANGLARAVVLGALSKLSLDPWFGTLFLPGPFPPLAEDLFFLFAPLLAWLWPHGGRPNPDDENLPDRLRKHLARPAATNGARIWSLRYLPVREGYSLLTHFSLGRPYRSASKVEVRPLGN